MVISDAVASMRLRHPTIVFTLRPSPYLDVPEGQQKLMDRGLHYNSPGVKVQYPPELHTLTGGASEATLWG